MSAGRKTQPWSSRGLAANIFSMLPFQEYRPKVPWTHSEQKNPTAASSWVLLLEQHSCVKNTGEKQRSEKSFLTWSVAFFFLPLYKVTAFKSRGRFGATGVGRRTAIRAAIIESRDCEAVQFQQEDDVWDFFSPSRQMIASLSLARMNVASSARLCPPPPFLAASSAASRNYRVGLTATLMAAYSRRLLSLAVPEEAASFSGPSARIMGAKPE